VEQAFFNHRGDIVLTEPAGTQPGIQFAIDQVDTFVAKGEVRDRGARVAVGETKRNELDCLGRVEVREIAPGVPSLGAVHSLLRC
jgi:hypothetical protein